MSSQTESAGVFRHERNFPYTAAQIFAAFSDPQRLAKWWGPNGFTNTIELFEFKNNGRWKLVMHGPDGTNYPNESVFAAIEPNQKIVIQHTSAPHFTLTVSLQNNAIGTTVVWEQVFADAAVGEKMRSICVPGNEQNLDRLQQLLADYLHH